MCVNVLIHFAKIVNVEKISLPLFLVDSQSELGGPHKCPTTIKSETERKGAL